MRVSLIVLLLLISCIMIASMGAGATEKDSIHLSKAPSVQTSSNLTPQIIQAAAPITESTGDQTGTESETEPEEIGSELNQVVPVHSESGASSLPLATVHMERFQEMTEDDIVYGPYEHAEWIMSGGSAGSVDVGVRNVIGDTDHHQGWGLGANVVPGASANFILPLAVNPDAHIRYLKIVDYLPAYDMDPEIKIRSVQVHNGYETVAWYTPEFWVHENERVHIVDLGDYYSFDKGLQMEVSVVNGEESYSNLYIITGYGALLES